MRIIGGEYKSRIIGMPMGVDMRPTQDKVREAVFNIISGRIEGANVLDLYAGSGAYGIEALSRGAEFAVFVDNNPKCVKAIRDNIENLGIGGQAWAIVRADAVKALKSLGASYGRFDLVFLDPPYHEGMARNSLRNILEYDILAPNNCIILEHYKKDSIDAMEGLLRVDERRYGDTVISIFKR